LERVNPVERRQYSRVPLDITIEIYHIHDGNTEMPPILSCAGEGISAREESLFWEQIVMSMEICSDYRSLCN